MSEGSFHRFISEHLALTERNKRLEGTMPLGRYREHYGGGDPLPPQRADESSTEMNVVCPPGDQGSWWDTSAERPVPAEFEWGDVD
jgi:hypothetical protein